MSHDLVSVIIPNYNGCRWLPKLLDSIAGQTERRFRIVIVDDASTDDSVAFLRARWPDVAVIQNPRNMGFAASCNRGIQSAETPYIALLNNDTHVASAWLAEGLAPFAEPQVGSVASLSLLAEPPHLIDTAGDLYSVAGGAVKRNHLLPASTAEELSPRCFAASGVSAFYRREALMRVGGLDERFESYYEDVDLGFRLAWAGYRCVFAVRSVCYHYLSSSYNPGGWRYHFNSARNAEWVWWANMPAGLRRRHLMAHLAFLGLQSLNKLRQGHFLAYAAGKWAALRTRDHIRFKRGVVQRLASVTAEEIEARLVADWRSLHLRGRRAGRCKAVPAS